VNPIVDTSEIGDDRGELLVEPELSNGPDGAAPPRARWA
jgi:hypothetical protein